MVRPFKKKGVFFKLIGTGILLLSFTTQNYFYANWNARSAELEAAMRDRALIDKGSLLNEILYFITSQTKENIGGINPNELAAQKISQAALKTAQSQSIVLNVIDSVSKDEKKAQGMKLYEHARSVHNYSDLISFWSFVIKEYDKYIDQMHSEYNLIREKQSMAKTIYLGLYLAGLLILLYGLYYEWRGVEE